MVIEGHVSYQSDSPDATRLGLCYSLVANFSWTPTVASDGVKQSKPHKI